MENQKQQNSCSSGAHIVVGPERFQLSSGNQDYLETFPQEAFKSLSYGGLLCSNKVAFGRLIWKTD